MDHSGHSRAAKAEGELTVYSSTNEQEALPLLKLFQDVTGVKINFIRGAEGPLVSRIMTETRAGQPSWDITTSSIVNRLPLNLVKQIDPPEAKNLRPEARDPGRRWYGVYAAYNAPAYNTRLVKKEELPSTYEEFLQKTQWKGRIAIDSADREWMLGIFRHFGEEKGRKLLEDIVRTLNPVIVDGHLALARALAAGEYMVALSNYSMLTSNMAFTGAPSEFFPLDPVSMFISQAGVSARAPHPNAARLLTQFMLEPESQLHMANAGVLPVVNGIAEKTNDDARPYMSAKLFGAGTHEHQERLLKIAAEIQRQCWIDVPHIPLGIWFQPAAWQSTIDGIPDGFPIFWGARRV